MRPIVGSGKWESWLNILGVRHLQVFILFLCMAVNFLTRQNITMAIVMMTDKKTPSKYPVFDWSMLQKSTVLSIFHIGYLVMNIVASFLVNRYQNKMLLLISVGIASILTLLTPMLVIVGGFYTLVLIRVLLGILQGFLMPVAVAQLSRWIPPAERSRCAGLVLVGANFGIMLTSGISGWIGDKYGWPSIFYFTGYASVAWSILWAVLASDDPKSCWFISEKEREYIEKELILKSEISKDKKIPWKGLLSNKPCWALLLTAMGYYWWSWTLYNEIPIYFNSILHLDSTFNGLIGAIPHGCLCIVNIFTYYGSDLLINRGILSVGACRKIFNSIGHWGSAASLLILCFTTDLTVTIISYIVGVILLGFPYVGFMLNQLDIVPSYAGVFMGITTGFATITAFGGNEFLGIIVTDPENQYQWKTVFGVSAGILFLSNLIFIIFGSGEVQNVEGDISNSDVKISERL